MDPFTVMAVATAASTAISGIANYVASKDVAEAQEGATQTAKDEVARITALVNKVQDPQFNGVLTDAEIADLVKFDPNFPKKIVGQAPEALPQIAAEMPTFIAQISEADPTVAKFIEEKMPELITASSEGAKMGRDAQRSALQALRKSGTEGDILSQSEMMRARESAAQAEAGQRGAITEEMARRGQLGGGRELLMKLTNQQNSTQNAAMMGQQAAEDAVKRRLASLVQAGSLGGQMFEQDVGIEKSNTSAINAFNERNTNAMRNIENARVNDINNRAMREAAAQRQRELANTGIRNDYAGQETAYNRNQANSQWSANEAFKQNETAYNRGQASDRANILNTADAEQRNATRDMVLSERARADDLEQQRFSNDMSKINAQQGIANQNIAISNQQAQAAASAARNNAGVYGDLARTGGELAGAYAGMKAGEEANAIDLELQKARLKELRGY